MPATLRHFAINADDIGRAKRFYESVFGWSFTPWGPPGFYQTRSAGDGLMGALQGRRQLAPDTPMPGVETTFAVPDLKATIAAIEAGGGRLLGPPYHIETVGQLVYFADSEGNIAGAMQYDEGVWT